MNGQRATLVDANTNTVSFAYDGFDRLATTTYPMGSSEALTYDADSNVTARTTRAGATIAYTYDTLNRLGTKSPPSSPVVTYTYDLNGRRTGVSDTSSAITAITAPGSTITYATTYTYDALNRPLSVSWTPAPTAAAAAPTDPVVFAHGYNAVNQRTSQAVNDPSTRVWIGYPSGSGTTSYTANTLNQYTAVGSVSPTHDGNGNLLTDGTTAFGYDTENRMVSASATGMSASYLHDGRGRRKSKTVNGTTTITITDADNRAVLDYDGASGTGGAILRWYAYGLGPNAVLSQMDIGAGTRTMLVPDMLGSIIGTMASSATAITPVAYRPYGSSASAPGQFGYTGQRVDAESGTYYYRARQYSTILGRFHQADPIGHAGGVHLYAYTDNDPLNAADPLGLYPVLLVTRPDGTKYVPMSTVKNWMQAQSYGQALGSSVPIAVPGEISNPQALVESWRSPMAIGTTMIAPAFAAFWSPGGPNDYKQKNAMFDAFGNFAYGATGVAAGFSTETLVTMGNALHRGANDPINTTDIVSGAYAINNGHTLSTIDSDDIDKIGATKTGYGSGTSTIDPGQGVGGGFGMQMIDSGQSGSGNNNDGGKGK